MRALTHTIKNIKNENENNNRQYEMRRMRRFN